MSLSRCRISNIVVFDLALETLEVLPIDLGTRVLILMVMGGYLAIGTRTRQGNVHVLNKIVIVRSLENLVNVCPCVSNISVSEDLIGFTKTGKMFVANCFPASLVLVDDISKKMLVNFASRG